MLEACAPSTQSPSDALLCDPAAPLVPDADADAAGPQQCAGCVCGALCNAVTCILISPPHNQDSEQSQHPKDPTPPQLLFSIAQHSCINGNAMCHLWDWLPHSPRCPGNPPELQADSVLLGTAEGWAGLCCGGGCLSNRRVCTLFTPAGFSVWFTESTCIFPGGVEGLLQPWTGCWVKLGGGHLDCNPVLQEPGEEEKPRGSRTLVPGASRVSLRGLGGGGAPHKPYDPPGGLQEESAVHGQSHNEPILGGHRVQGRGQGFVPFGYWPSH